MYLACLFLTYLINHFFQTGYLLSEIQEVAELSFIMSQVFEMLTFYILVIVFEMFDKNIQFSRRQTIISLLIFVAIGGLLTQPDLNVETVGNNYLIYHERYSVISICQLLFNFVASSWLTVMLYKSRKSAQSTKQKHLIVSLFFGLILAIFVPSFPHIFREYMQHLTKDQLIITTLIDRVTQNFGMLIIGIAFIRISKHPWLLQRQKVHLLLVFTREGIDLYSKTFSDKITQEDLTLLTGGFSAVSALFKEATDTSGEVKSIQLEDKELRLIAREEFICALLVDYSTQASELAHKNFTNDFEQKFSKELNNFKGLISVFEPAEEIALQYFS